MALAVGFGGWNNWDLLFRTQPSPPESEALSLTNALQDVDWELVKENARNYLLVRDCPLCASTHKTIVYKRITPLPPSTNYKSLFLDHWRNTNNVLNWDFEL